MTQRLVIIRGNSGSGKSSTARRLQHEMGYETLLIQQDVVRREMLRTRDSEGNPAIAMIHEMALYGKRIGYDVIIEGILASGRYGEMLRDVMKEFDVSHVYYLDVSFDETLRRHNKKPSAHEFGEVEMRAWWLEKDLLRVDDEVTISGDIDEATVLDTMKQDVI